MKIKIYPLSSFIIQSASNINGASHILHSERTAYVTACDLVSNTRGWKKKKLNEWKKNFSIETPMFYIEKDRLKIDQDFQVVLTLIVIFGGDRKNRVLNVLILVYLSFV